MVVLRQTNALLMISVVDNHCCHITIKFAVGISENQEKLPTFYWLPKLHKRPYKSRFKYYDSCYERDGINRVWSIKNSNEEINKINKLKSKRFKTSTLSTYDFSTLYTTLPHHLIKDTLIDLIEHAFLERKHFIWLVTTNVLSSLPICTKILIYDLVKTCVRPLFIFWIIFC